MKVKERKKWEDNLKEEEKRKRKILHDEIAQLKKVQELDRSTCQQLQEDIVDLRRELQGKINAESRATRELNQVQIARNSVEQIVTQQSETIKELLAIKRSLKERLEDEKKKRKVLVGLLNEYNGRLKVNAIQEFIHSTKFKDVLAKVIGPWFKNGFNFCFAQVKDAMQRVEQNLSMLKGVNMGRKIDFPIEPYVAYP
ncbi:hypothetical protein Dimus_022976 [Dionaea muscipula]